MKKCSSFEGWCFFGAFLRGRTFLFQGEIIVENEKITDVTGVELTLGNITACLGNGEHFDENGNLIECCCDECDYLILCLENKKKCENVSKIVNK